MSREIKFRAWDILLHKMFYDCEYLPPFKANKGGVVWTMMQWTGLTDKNGKDIYEGDIIKLKLHVPRNKYIYSVVEFNLEDCGFAPFCPSMNRMWWDKDFCEVIGNIYKNSELLTAEEKK